MNRVSDEQTYESFITRAFDLSNQRIERAGDPAGLADANRFKDSDLAAIKAGVAYAMSTYAFHVRNYLSNKLTAADDNDITTHINETFNASSHKEVLDQIISFNKRIVQKYNL
ncbi:hypothetical protein [Streptomyces sp. NRRL F-5630]|uniref:hypothetical protein n=1 Tax=Streptomyces sp. NRRL F-5630 TaxID=1463864 RepID=UPI003EBF52CE